MKNLINFVHLKILIKRMDNKVDKEITEFLKPFSKESAEPDSKFRNSLRKQVIQEYRKKGFFQSLNFLYLTSFVVLAVVAVSFVFDLPREKTVDVVDTPAVDKIRKNEVLSNIIKSNSDQLIKQLIEARGVNSQSAESIVETFLTDTLIEPSQKSFRYAHNTTSVISGNLNGICKAVDYNGPSQIEYFSYQDSDNKVYSKRVAYDERDNLVFYALSKNTGDDIEVIYYLNSSDNAVRYTSSKSNFIPASYPASFPVVNEKPEEIFEGLDTEVRDEVQLNGKSYYIVEIKKNADCGNETRNIYTLMYVNSDSFEIEKTEVYLDFVVESNLVYSISTTNEISNDEISKFEDIFKFDLDVSVVDTSRDGLIKYFQRIEENPSSYPISEEVRENNARVAGDRDKED